MFVEASYFSPHRANLIEMCHIFVLSHFSYISVHFLFEDQFRYSITAQVCNSLYSLYCLGLFPQATASAFPPAFRKRKIQYTSKASVLFGMVFLKACQNPPTVDWF